MIRAKIGHLCKRYLCGIAHEIANAAMEVRRRVVKVLSLFNTDQVGNLRREQRTAVPARDSSSVFFHCYQCAVLRLGDVLQPLIRIVLQPWHTIRLIEPASERARPHVEWRRPSHYTVLSFEEIGP